MKIRTAIIATITGLMPIVANALALEIPAGAIQTVESADPHGTTTVPIDVFANGSVPSLPAEGSIISEAWKVSSTNLSTLQIMAPLRQQIQDGGYEVLLDCETNQCGGFDFRYEINLLPEPEMHVDLGDFRYLSARRTGDSDLTEYIYLIVSRAGQTGFVQMTRVGDPEIQPAVIVASTKSADPAQTVTPMPEGSLATLLETIGRAPLEDLRFQTGSSKLGDDGFGSLAELAAYLNTNPDKSVALVGHTDAEGSLAGNLALSKKRAKSVLNRLVTEFDVPVGQLEAAGVGYLVPRASNLTETGRTQNRRVEVILTSTR